MKGNEVGRGFTTKLHGENSTILGGTQNRSNGLFGRIRSPLNRSFIPLYLEFSERKKTGKGASVGQN